MDSLATVGNGSLVTVESVSLGESACLARGPKVKGSNRRDGALERG